MNSGESYSEIQVGKGKQVNQWLASETEARVGVRMVRVRIGRVREIRVRQARVRKPKEADDTILKPGRRKSMTYLQHKQKNILIKGDNTLRSSH